jgi:hypothetical protein
VVPAFRRLLLPTALLVAGGSASAWPTVDDAPVFDLTVQPSVNAANFVEIRHRDGLRAVRRIAIASFTVEFVDSRETPAARAAGQAKRAAGSKPVAAAISPDPDELQPIVDALYDTAVETWHAAGMEVLPPESVAALPGFAGLQAVPMQTPLRVSTHDSGGLRTSLVVAAHRRPAYFIDGRAPPESAERALAKDGDVTVMSAHLVVDFAALRATRERVFHHTITPGYVQSIVAGESGYRLITPGGAVVTATLVKPIRAPGSPVPPGTPVFGDDDEPDEHAHASAIPAPVYYDQALRYLGAAQDMILGEMVGSISGQH